MAVTGNLAVSCFLMAALIGISSAIVMMGCENAVLSLECPKGFLIRIEKATYGRTRNDPKCQTTHNPTTSCMASTSDTIVREKCDGKQSCSVAATNSVFGDPCIGTYKYLEIEYTCDRRPVFKRERVCEDETLTLDCPAENPAIYIYSAMYGRKLPGSDVCPSKGHTDNTDCAACNARKVVESLCGWNNSECSVTASNKVFGDPCVGTWKYLQVKYSCARREVTCEGDTMTLECPSGQNLLILDGNYGRMTGPETCPSSDILTQNCESSITVSTVQKTCNGQPSCSVGANNNVFGDPCVGTLKYLEVIYQCV